MYIVSALVLSALAGNREDVVAPATGHPETIRQDGKIVSVPGLSGNPSRKSQKNRSSYMAKPKNINVIGTVTQEGGKLVVTLTTGAKFDISEGMAKLNQATRHGIHHEWIYSTRGEDGKGIRKTFRKVGRTLLAFFQERVYSEVYFSCHSYTLSGVCALDVLLRGCRGDSSPSS